MKRIGIIGAGISGLTVSYRLKQLLKENVEIRIHEKAGRTGGTIFTERYSGFVIEGGPDCFITEKPWAMELASEIGIKNRLIGTDPDHRKTFVFSRGRLHQIPEGLILMIPTKILPLLTSSLFSLPGKIRMGMEVFLPAKKSEDDESLKDFILRRFGREALEKIAEPLVAGVHAGDPDTMSVKSSFPRFVEMERKYRSLILGMLKMRREFKKRTGEATERSMFMTFISGLSELTEKLEFLIGHDSIELNSEVVKILREGRKYHLILRDGNRRIYDTIILALPSYTAGMMIEEIAPELSGHLKGIPFISTATVTLAYKLSDIHHDLNGYGFVVPSREGRRIMAATWSSSKFKYRVPEGYGMIRCFVGGARNQWMVDLRDDELLRIVREEIRDIMGIHAEPHITRIYRWHRAMPQYVIGHENNLREIEREMEKLPGLFLTGSSYRGIGISDCIKNATEVALQVKKFIEGSI